MKEINKINEEKKISEEDKIKQMLDTLKLIFEDFVDTKRYDASIIAIYRKDLITVISEEIYQLIRKGRSKYAYIKLKDGFIRRITNTYNKVVIEKILKDKKTNTILITDIVTIENYEIKEHYENLNPKEVEEIENKILDIDFERFNNTKLLLMHSCYINTDSTIGNLCKIKNIPEFFMHLERIEFIEVSYEQKRNKKPFMKAFTYNIDTPLRKISKTYYAYKINENDINNVKYILFSSIEAKEYYEIKENCDIENEICPSGTAIRPFDARYLTLEFIEPFPCLCKYLNEVMTLKELKEIPELMKKDGESIINKVSIISPNFVQSLKERLENAYKDYKAHFNNMMEQLEDIINGNKNNIEYVTNLYNYIDIKFYDGKKISIYSGIHNPFKIEIK